MCSADGIRKSKTNASGTTNYTLDGPNILLETTGAGALQARNTNYPGMCGGLASQNRGGVSGYFAFDSQHSTRLFLSSAGAILISYGYNAFGILVQNSGSGPSPTPFLYCGEEGYQWDRVYWMTAGQRQLDAINGCWANRDPIGMLGGPNEYGYCENNPVTGIDPSGLRPPNHLEIERFDKLRRFSQESARSTADPVNAKDVECIIKVLTNELLKLGQGEPMPPQLGAIFWGIGQLGDMRYSFKGRLPSVMGNAALTKVDTDKCNYFVGNAFAVGGCLVWGSGGYPIREGGRGFSPATAESMANPHTPLPSVRRFPVVPVDSPAEVGDIFSWWSEPEVHHVTIYVGCGMYINASGIEGVVIRHQKYIDNQQKDMCKKYHVPPYQHTRRRFVDDPKSYPPPWVKARYPYSHGGRY